MATSQNGEESKEVGRKDTEPTNASPKQENMAGFKAMSGSIPRFDSRVAQYGDFQFQSMPTSNIMIPPMPMVWPQQKLPFYPPFQGGKNPHFSHGSSDKTVKTEPIFLKNYSNREELRKAFGNSTSNYNSPHFDIDSIQRAEFFILRSSNDDDIHKAIKYGVWSSTPRNNILLSETFKRCQNENTPIYLIFTVVTSEQYCGVAKMESDVDMDKIFDLWWQSHKWKGLFKLSWVFIKDIDYNSTKQITDDERQVIGLRDGSKINLETGKKLLKIFKDGSDHPSIFGCFEYMDGREQEILLPRRKPMMPMPFLPPTLGEFQLVKSPPMGGVYSRRGGQNNYRGGDHRRRYNYNGNKYHQDSYGYHGSKNYYGKKNYHNENREEYEEAFEPKIKEKQSEMKKRHQDKKIVGSQYNNNYNHNKGSGNNASSNKGDISESKQMKENNEAN